MGAYPIDNLSLWMEVRYHDLGPYKDHLLASVRHYEAKIKSLEEYVEELEAKLAKGEALLAALDAYAAGKPSNPPVTRARKTTLAELEGQTDE